MIGILAGDHEQAHRFVEERGLGVEGRDWRYLMDRRSIHGLRLTAIEVVGTFWSRRDAIELHDTARAALQSTEGVTR